VVEFPTALFYLKGKKTVQVVKRYLQKRGEEGEEGKQR